ncbi:hypothetical protein K488DRAFT_58181 [Vararia minispora EC-137]|uniref:Uncharacterized protein n=1 Tax=Vararia minispora EC-137 TaxID=1314806 RepID=A0ACB8QA38_9AGAM|nr:hypothetical protein K488DRAFT_58181 [Vararia minispora EC-137]
MSKRSLSPVVLPPSKRLHISKNNTFTSRPLRSFDTLLSDEIILLVFSFLSPSDLCAAQSVSHNWSRLALDNQLWKSLFVGEYGRQRLRGGKGFVKRADGREVKPLPARVPPDPAKEAPRDWKWMFKISSNWRTGRCQLTRFTPFPFPPNHPPPISERMHVLLAGPMTIYASSKPSQAPTITITCASSSDAFTVYPTVNSLIPVQITSLAADQCPPLPDIIRFAVCLSTGELAVYELRGHHAQMPTRTHHYAGSRSRRTHPILQAAYHHPLLFTLSKTFSLSVYDATREALQLVHHLSSFSSWPPASLVLTAPSANTFKLLITYASPVYPQHWSLGVTEVLMSCPARASTSAQSAFRLLSTRSVRAFDVPPGWANEARMRVVREQWARKTLAVAATNSDGKWVVLAPTETSCLACAPSFPAAATGGAHPIRRHWTPSSLPLQLYRVSFPPLDAGASAAPRLTFVRYLYGQTSPVASLALADGRCVSLGVDGSVWAWDLETARGVQVYSASPSMQEEPMQNGVLGLITFDERRIISSSPGGVLVRDFDT